MASRLLQPRVTSDDEPEESRMSDKSVADPMNDELEAAAAPATPVRPNERSEELADFDDSLYDRDTEPSLDAHAQILLLALRAGLNQ